MRSGGKMIDRRRNWRLRHLNCAKFAPSGKMNHNVKEEAASPLLGNEDGLCLNLSITCSLPACNTTWFHSMCSRWYFLLAFITAAPDIAISAPYNIWITFQQRKCIFYGQSAFTLSHSLLNLWRLSSLFTLCELTKVQLWASHRSAHALKKTVRKTKTRQWTEWAGQKGLRKVTKI